MNKVNDSLATLSKVTRGLWISGLALLLIVIFIQVAVGRGMADRNGGAFVFGAFSGPLLNVFFTIGVTLLGLSIFSAFLRITAKAIIEGLGGNLVNSGLAVIAPATSTNSTSSDSATSAPVKPYVSGPDSWQQLSGREYKAWQAAGQPNLKSWDEAGRPDFLSWLAQNS